MKQLLMLSCFLLTNAMASSIFADHGHSGCSCCMCGHKVCVLEVSQEEEKESYFDVESKEICIPGIRLPWDKCGTRRCGGVRKVCVLKTEKRDVTVCKYDWSIRTICKTCCKKHRIKCGKKCGQVCQDDRVPFEYTTADREVVTVSATSVQPMNIATATEDKAEEAKVAKESSWLTFPKKLASKVIPIQLGDAKTKSELDNFKSSRKTVR